MEIFSTPKNYGLSNQNEPSQNVILSANVRQYPDMYYAYAKMKEHFCNDNQEIMLGNGYENCMKNVLLALKPKTMYWSKPAWRMVDTFCRQLDIQPINDSFIINDINIVTNDFNNIPYADVCYLTYHTNCNFNHSNDLMVHLLHDDKFKNRFKYIIVDASYLTDSEMKSLSGVVERFKNVIVIGSYDKLVGCGLRLGFAIFNKIHSESILLQKERCINMLAYNFIMSTDFNFPISKYYEKIRKYSRLNSSIIDVTRNFIRVEGTFNTKLPHQVFKIGDKTFSKFGIPSNECEYNGLATVLGLPLTEINFE